MIYSNKTKNQRDQKLINTEQSESPNKRKTIKYVNTKSLQELQSNYIATEPDQARDKPRKR